MELSSKSRFILYNFVATVIASLIIIGIFLLFIGNSREFLRMTFLFDSSYAFLLMPVFGVIFSIIWSNIIFDNFIDSKELSNGKCISIGFMNGFLPYICAFGVYLFLFVSLSMGISIDSLDSFFILWMTYVLFGMILFGVLIFLISISTVFLWRHHISQQGSIRK